MKRSIILAFLVLGLVGCATMDLPAVDSPVGKIAAAEERSAKDNPQAQLHLQMAKEATDQSIRMKEDRNKRGAKLALMRANADANLALALLRRDAARGEVAEVQDRINELQSDMEKTTK